MSFFSRIGNAFRSRKIDDDIEEELRSHFEDARQEGRDLEEIRRAFGSTLRVREAAHDAVVATWMESLYADARFGLRQLLKNKNTAVVAILSLGLGMGACMAAFRLIDATMFRPLPVSDPGSLYVLGTLTTEELGAEPFIAYGFNYPGFRMLRAAVKDQASMMAITFPQRINLTYSSEEAMERVYMQHVSGWMFGEFGLRPALGRLLTESDDVTPGAHPYAVISHDYWTRRFGGDPKVLGRKFRSGGDSFEVIGVAPEGFTGTEAGTFTDVFLPTMMYNAKAFESPGWQWFKPWVHVHKGVQVEAVRERLAAAMRVHRQERAKGWHGQGPQWQLDAFLNAPVVLTPTAQASDLQRDYGRSLIVLGLLVGMVLLIACVNVANLMTAQAAARAREMALRVSIGAGRARLIQLVLIESAWIAAAASALGIIFAWWAAPLVVGMINPVDAPVRLDLPLDFRVTIFAVLLTLIVTMLFGLTPALRASGVKPASALKGGEEARSRHRLMNGLIAAQVAFCLVVQLIAGLFVSTFDHLEKQPLGFSPTNVVTLETVTAGIQAPELWYQVADRLRALPEVEDASLSIFPLMSGGGWDLNVWANGRTPENNPSVWFLGVSPTWLDTMKIPLREGRQLLPSDEFPSVALVNQSFARRYFPGENAVGKFFETMQSDKRVATQIVGITADARYTGMRGPIPATVYAPYRNVAEGGPPLDHGTFNVRTRGANSLSLSALLRQEVRRSRPGFRVANIRTQDELVRAQTIRERLLATLSLFFGIAALMLAGVGLYGVLSYAVTQRRRELGIRIALGAGAREIANRVSASVLAMVGLGAGVGLAAGIFSARYIKSLLFGVKATDPMMLGWAMFAVAAAVVLAALPAVIRAVRIDPASLLRSD